MNRITIESKHLVTNTEQAGCGNQRAVIYFDRNSRVETMDVETLILVLNPEKETLEEILRKRYEEAA